MRKIVYYVACSLDGFIAGENDDVSDFTYNGDGVDKYLADLKGFDTVIMGRKTYEFGYNYGISPGQPAYANMKHYIFSNKLHFDNPHHDVQVKKMDIREIETIQKEEGTAIYLCGGGQFAAWLLEYKKIDTLKLKVNPLLLGKGIRLFAGSTAKYKLRLLDTQDYDNGLQIMTYDIIYP